MSPKIERTNPPYLQIADAVRHQIESGALRDGDMVPSVRQLAAEWSVAHGTARTALAVLRTEGLVVGVPGTGTIVQRRSSQGAGIHASDARRTGRIYPADQHARITAADVVGAPDQVGVALGVQPGAQVIRRIRVTYRAEPDGTETPLTSSVSWFKGVLVDRAPRLLKRDRIPEGTFSYIESVTGQVATEVLEELQLSAATSDEAEIFGVSPGTPVIRGENWLLDDAEDVIEYGQSVRRPDRKITYRFRLDQQDGTGVNARQEPTPGRAPRWRPR